MSRPLNPHAMRRLVDHIHALVSLALLVQLEIMLTGRDGEKERVDNEIIALLNRFLRPLSV